MPTRYIQRRADFGANDVSRPNSNPIFVDSDDDQLKFATGTSGQTTVDVVTESQTQTLTNKTLSAPTFSGQATGYRRPATIYLTDATVLLTTALAGQVSIATRASSTQTFTLPIATTAGMEFVFVCGDAGGEIIVTANAADDILLKATEDAGASIDTAAGGSATNTGGTNVIGDHIHLISDGVSRWYMIGQSGIWA